MKERGKVCFDRKGNAYVTSALSRTTINTINSRNFKHLSSHSSLFIKVHIGLFETFFSESDELDLRFYLSGLHNNIHHDRRSGC